jgi:hypothetical protein
VVEIAIWLGCFSNSKDFQQRSNGNPGSEGKNVDLNSLISWEIREDLRVKKRVYEHVATLDF